MPPGLWFVGGHPMAGLETAGYGAADADLFADRPWIVVPGALAGPSDVARVVDLARACRARVVEMDAAPTTGRSRGSATCRWSSPPRSSRRSPGRPARSATTGPRRSALAAGGWRDTTRVARGDPAMGAAIAVTNAPALAARLRDLQGRPRRLAGRARAKGWPTRGRRRRSARGGPRDPRGPAVSRRAGLRRAARRGPRRGRLVRPPDRRPRTRSSQRSSATAATSRATRWSAIRRSSRSSRTSSCATGRASS